MDAAQPAPGAPAPEAPSPTCFRHSDRESYVRCTRCDRNVCPDCRRDAAVGYQCVECVKSGHQSVRQARTVFGGRITSRPYATIALIVLNIAAYVLELVRPGIVPQFDMLGAGSIQNNPNDDPLDLATMYHQAGVAHGEWYRLLTGTFLHLQPDAYTGLGPIAITHIVFNMYWLWTLGRVVEDRLGVLRFLGLYLLAALGSSTLVYLIAPHTETLGASGAVFGLAGGYWILSRRQGYDPLGGNQLLGTMVLWMVISASITSWQGHLGGLLTGIAAGAALGLAPHRQRGLVQAVCLSAVLLLLATLIYAATGHLTSI
ncbi:rhomboid family intramembrane serine protease [Kitasatospora sp. NPDC059795]|uniref:rhomboid family intramembrane serine protease n=1 Tax=Kitasatospora sp. NPDC059795 TaxID=3346949 RepID=UPI003647A959